MSNINSIINQIDELSDKTYEIYIKFKEEQFITNSITQLTETQLGNMWKQFEQIADLLRDNKPETEPF